MSETPGCVWRSRAISAVTLWPGNWPPSPGFEPCAILICNSEAKATYSAVTPKRPEAICLMRELRSVRNRAGSSPPSPQFERAPRLLNARAIVSCASADSDPCDMPPDEKRCTIDPTDRPWRTGKNGLDKVTVEAERLEGLGAAVAGDVGDPELRHHLEHAVLDRLLEADLRLGRRGPVAADPVALGQGRDRLERQP